MVDPDWVRTKLGKLEEYLRGLAETQDSTEAEYRRDRDLRDLVERWFENAIRASLDIAAHLNERQASRIRAHRTRGHQ